MRLLVIEDEHRIANSIKTGLEQENYAVDVAYDGTHGFDLAASEDYDVIILDLMLPGKSGLEICRELRAAKIHTPILILTAKSQLEDKVSGLDSGADDYLTKPFAFEELLARIRALVRRPGRSYETPLTRGQLTLDPKNSVAENDGKTLKLSRKEFAVLEYLMRNPGKVLTKEKIIAHAWNYDADILPNTVEANIKNLRRKLGRPELITTVRGFGYKLG
jgi:DNA-binding response OmpR family regulator